MSEKKPEEIAIISNVKSEEEETIAKKYAKSKGYAFTGVQEETKTFGEHMARILCNSRMASQSDALVAFHDGSDTEVGHMVNVAKIRGLKVRTKAVSA